MIGAGIFALLGQVAELAGSLFPIIFIAGTIVASFSAYSYVKMSNAFPSGGGIAMHLKKAYSKSTFTAFAALLMAFSMFINESLVARTFGTYTLQLFNMEKNSIWVPILGVLLIISAFLVNISGNEFIQKSSFVMAFVKIVGIGIFAISGLWVSGINFEQTNFLASTDHSVFEVIGSVALALLAYKGFTTITNSGDEIKNPHKNGGRAIVISLVICTLVYFLVNLSVAEIIHARDYSLAEAAKPAFGKYRVWFTIGIAIVARVSGIIASIFAVSRMTTMLTEMKLIPHSHFGMPGTIHQHMLVYIVTIANFLTVFIDLSRIASLGAIFYIVMDIGIHWGLMKNLQEEVKPSRLIVSTAIILDAIVLGAFLWIKATSDIFIVIVAAVAMLIIYFGDKWFLAKQEQSK